MKNKFTWIGGGVLIVGAFLAWVFWASTRPLPGTKIADLGRGHVEIGAEVQYNSNPPTSGQHYEDWVRAGVYDEPKDDRNLVHSLEHGYIVMSYKCNTNVILEGAQRPMSKLSPSEIGSNEEDSIGSNSSTLQNDDTGDSQADCDNRKNQLEEVYNKKGKRKLIVVLRPDLDTNFALSAWNYLDKFDIMDSVRIEKFIDAHLNNGPERTME